MNLLTTRPLTFSLFLHFFLTLLSPSIFSLHFLAQPSLPIFHMIFSLHSNFTLSFHFRSVLFWSIFLFILSYYVHYIFPVYRHFHFIFSLCFSHLHSVILFSHSIFFLYAISPLSHMTFSSIVTHSFLSLPTHSAFSRFSHSTFSTFLYFLTLFSMHFLTL